MGGWIIEVYKFSIPINMALSCYRRNILKDVALCRHS